MNPMSEETSSDSHTHEPEASQPEVKLRVRKLSKSVNFPPSLPDSVLRRGSLQISNNSSPRSSRDAGRSGFVDGESDSIASIVAFSSSRSNHVSTARAESSLMPDPDARIPRSPRQTKEVGSKPSPPFDFRGDPLFGHSSSLHTTTSPRSNDDPSSSSGEKNRSPSLRGTVVGSHREKTSPVKPLIRSISLEAIFKDDASSKDCPSPFDERVLSTNESDTVVEQPSTFTVPPSESESVELQIAAPDHEIDASNTDLMSEEGQRADEAKAMEDCLESLEVDELIAESADPFILEESGREEQELAISNPHDQNMAEASLSLISSNAEKVFSSFSADSFTSENDHASTFSSRNLAPNAVDATQPSSTTVAVPSIHASDRAEDPVSVSLVSSSRAPPAHANTDASRKPSTQLASVAHLFGSSTSPFDVIPTRHETHPVTGTGVRPISAAPVVRPVVAPLPGNLFGAPAQKPVVDPFSAPPPDKALADPLSPIAKKPAASAVDVFSRQPPVAAVRDPSFPPAPPGVTVPVPLQKSQEASNPQQILHPSEKPVAMPKPSAPVPAGMIPTPHGYVPIPQPSRGHAITSTPSPALSPREEDFAGSHQHQLPPSTFIPPTAAYAAIPQKILQPAVPPGPPINFQQAKPPTNDPTRHIPQRPDISVSSAAASSRRAHSKTPPPCSFARFGFGGKVAVFHPKFDVSAGLRGLDERKCGVVYLPLFLI